MERAANCLFKSLRRIKKAASKLSRRPDHRRGRVVPDQPVHSHGVQHQVDSEYRSRGRRLRLGVASRGVVGERHQLPRWPLNAACAA